MTQNPNVTRTTQPIASALEEVLVGDCAACVLLSDPASASPWSRWSYVPSEPSRVLCCRGRGAKPWVRGADGETGFADEAAALDWLWREARALPPGPAPFSGGWVGYLSYDLGRVFESQGGRAADDVPAPWAYFVEYSRVRAFDHATGEAWDIRHPGVAMDLPAPRWSKGAAAPRASLDRAGYEGAVARAIEYIRGGDIYQVNLARRESFASPLSPREVVRKAGRGWFGGLIETPEVCLVSLSPELFVDVSEGGIVTTRPMKGTRPPGGERELLLSDKDRAELVMIVDLERNDLGRVCEVGSVRVTQARAIETHPTVLQAVAEVQGQLRSDWSLRQLLEASFPGGSVTGAPKIRAMQIIEELEPVRRGPYCGAMGYIAHGGHVRMNISIRTLVGVPAQGVYHAWVGAGIVADSTPEGEYEETRVKARAMRLALGVEEP